MMADPAQEADRLAFFDTLYEGFRRAAAASAEIAEYYCIGGLVVLLRFAGPALRDQLGPALAHLSIAPASNPALTICLWDSASTATPPPLLLNSLIELLRLRWFEQLDGRREIKAYSGGRIRSIFHLGPDILSAIDHERNLAVYWLPDAAAIPYYERGYPLQALLSLWSAAQGRYFVHAAAVGGGAGGVLLAGPSGAGKSTTTLACLASNLRIAADDYTLIAPGSTARGYSLYNTVKLRTFADLARFPEYSAAVANPDRADEKPMIALAQQFPQRVLHDFPLRALVLPQVGAGRDSSLRPASAAAALRALAPSTMLQLPGTDAQTWRVLAALVRQLPAYTLELGSDLPQIPALLSGLLEDLP